MTLVRTQRRRRRSTSRRSSCCRRRSEGRPPALRPAAEDEGRHEPGPEALWNESWYFDAVSDDGTLGVYVRLGRLPNQGVALYTACICGPGRPSVMLVDAAAPLPAPEDEEQAIETASVQRRAALRAPLERFAVRARGTAEAHDDHSAPLRGEPGEPVEVELDLVWETDGIPYAWRAVDALRDPLPRQRHGARRRRADRARRGPGSATTRGARATGGRSTGCGARCTSTTAPTPTPSACPRCRATASATCSEARSSRRSRPSRPSTSGGPDGLIDDREHRLGAAAARARVAAARLRSAAPGGARRAAVAVPAGDVPRARRRRPRRQRLGGVEPGAARGLIGRRADAAARVGCPHGAPLRRPPLHGGDRGGADDPRRRPRSTWRARSTRSSARSPPSRADQARAARVGARDRHLALPRRRRGRRRAARRCAPLVAERAAGRGCGSAPRARTPSRAGRTSAWSATTATAG